MSAKKKTTTEAELREWRKQGLSYKQISEKLGRSMNAVACAMTILGINGTKDDKGAALDERAPLYYERLKAGFNTKQIGDEFGMHRMTVVLALKRSGFPTSHMEVLQRMAAEAAHVTTPEGVQA